MQNIAIDERDINLYMSQTEEERHFAAHAVTSKFLKASANSINRPIYKKLLKLSLSDIDPKIQNQVAALISTSPALTSDIAIYIILKDLEPAAWLLENFKRFSESDLYTLILTGHQKARDAIAARQGLSENITNFICKECNVTTVEICLKNKNARISENGYQDLLERFAAKRPNIVDLVLKRDTLPEGLIRPILTKSEADLQTILSTFKALPLDIESRTLNNQIEKELAETVKTSWTAKLKKRAVAQLKEDGRLTHTLMIRKYLLLDAEFLVMAFSAISNRSEEELDHLLIEKRFVAITSIVRQTAPPTYLWPAFKSMIPYLPCMRDGSTEEKKVVRADFLHKLKRIYNIPELSDFEMILEKLQHIQVAQTKPTR